MNTKRACLLTGILGFLGLAITSCTKTDLIAKPEAQNRILSYKISAPAGEQPVLGVVDDHDSTITVYLPAYFYLSVLLPEITVSEGASVSPASNTVVENLLPLMQTGETISYTVTGKDGSKRTYRVHIISQQLPTIVNELTTNVSIPTTYTMAAASTASISMTITGQNFIIPNRLALIKVVLTDEAGNKISMPVTTSGQADEYLSTNNFNCYLSRSTHPELVAQLAADGLYQVTVYNYAQAVTLKNKIRIIKQ
jgi:hypothetical protein